MTPKICFMASVCTELVLPPETAAAAAALGAAWDGAAAAASLPALPPLLAIALLVAEGIAY